MSFNSRDGLVVVRYRYHNVWTKAPEVGMTNNSTQGHVSLGEGLAFPSRKHPDVSDNRSYIQTMRRCAVRNSKDP